MDTRTIGNFLKELRKEKGLTQEQLGEKVGASNKTVSRWENGNYLPSVECLSLLSDIYGVSINEIVAGQRLSAGQLPEVADNNLKNALELNENAYRRTEKWLSFFMLISTLVAIAIIILLPAKKLGLALTVLLIALVVILAFIGNTVNIVAMIYNKERSGSAR